MIVPKRYDEERCALMWLYLLWKDKRKNKKTKRKKTDKHKNEPKLFEI